MGALSNNQKGFFELLRTGLWGDIPVQGEGFRVFGQAKRQSRAIDSLLSDVDWNEVYQLAQEQSVQGLVLQGIETVQGSWLKVQGSWLKVHGSPLVPKVLLLQWIGEVQVIEQQNKEMNAFVAELIEKLRQNDIYVLLVKGQGIAQCYDKPLWRCSGDVDLFLSDSNYEIAKRVLVPLASEVETEYVGSKHLGMTIDGWVVELHGSLRVGLPNRINRELDDIQTDTFKCGNVRSWMNGRTQVFLLGKENDIVYVFVHFFNHFYKEGVGLRQLCDWCRLMWTYRDEIDVKKIEGCIQEMGLVSEWKAFYNLASRYLGMPDFGSGLMVHDSRFDKKADRIMEFILKSGNMGHKRGSWLMEHDSWLSRQYVVRKAFSMGRRIGDLINHARIFPLDSLRFFPRIMFNGVRSAMRGE